MNAAMKLFGLFICTLLGGSMAAEFARLRLDGGRIITSSTLRWIPGNGKILEHSIPVTEEDVSTVWCRARQHGAFAGGAFHAGVCTAPFLGQVMRVSDGYELLVSINGSARVKRFAWDKYSAPPHNSIASSEKQKNFLAVHMEKDDVPHAGFLIPDERRVYFVDGDKVRKSDEGFILAEDEPERYELNSISLEKKHKTVTKDEEVLKEVTLSNPGVATQPIAEMVEVTVRHLVYWGQIKGTYVGRKAFVVSPKPDTEEREVTWGVQNEFDSAHSKTLEYHLPPGTATDVKVIGVIRKTEAPYIGTLTAIYEDGTHLSRVVEGLHMDERLVLLKAVYSTPYYIHNNTKLEDVEEMTQIFYTSTTTTTTTTTTSTTTTTTTTPIPPKVSMIGPKKPVSDSLSSDTEPHAEEDFATDHSGSMVPSGLLLVVASCLLIFKTR